MCDDWLNCEIGYKTSELACLTLSFSTIAYRPSRYYIYSHCAEMPTIRKNRQNENSTLSEAKFLQKCYRRTTILWFFFSGFRATSYCRNRTSEKYAKYVITHNITNDRLALCTNVRVIYYYCDVKPRVTSTVGRAVNFKGCPIIRKSLFERRYLRRGYYVVISICIRSLLSVLSSAFFKFTVIVFQLYYYRFSRRFFNPPIVY